MGEYTIFECTDCGYRSEKIRWGVSMDNPSIRFLPAHCGKCGILTEADLTDHDILTDNFTCDDCGSDMTFLEHRESFECPKCGCRCVKTHQEGYW